MPPLPAHSTLNLAGSRLKPGGGGRFWCEKGPCPHLDPQTGEWGLQPQLSPGLPCRLAWWSHPSSGARRAASSGPTESEQFVCVTLWIGGQRAWGVSTEAVSLRFGSSSGK